MVFTLIVLKLSIRFCVLTEALWVILLQVAALSVALFRALNLTTRYIIIMA